MKPYYATLCIELAILFNLLVNSPARAETDPAERKVHHVAIVWLKQHGDPQIRQQYIEASKPLAALPGVLSYDIGVPAEIKRQRPNSAVDESYDLAVSGSFQNQQAMEDFLKSAEYLHVAQQVLRPLVEKYIVYDFIE